MTPDTKAAESFADVIAETAATFPATYAPALHGLLDRLEAAHSREVAEKDAEIARLHARKMQPIYGTDADVP